MRELLVIIRLGLDELQWRQRVKAAGDRWNPIRKLCEIKYGEAAIEEDLQRLEPVTEAPLPDTPGGQGTKQSGGKVLSSRTQPNRNRAAEALRRAAVSAGRTETELGAYFRRKRAHKRRDGNGTQVSEVVLRVGERATGIRAGERRPV